MRLLAGLVAPGPFVTVLTGDASLATRPMGGGRATARDGGRRGDDSTGIRPCDVHGAGLRGSGSNRDPGAQVKGAVLLAALEAEGATTVAGPSV